VHNAFAYHLTPGGFILESGAHALGCAVIPGGVDNTEQQVEAIAHLRPSGYTGTADFLKIVLDTAEKAGKNVSSLKHALVSGAALSPSLRAEFDARGIAVLQAYATAELGVIAYETLAREGMIINESIIVEIVRPGSGDPVSDGEVGEVVVTSRAFSAVRATSQILGESPKRGSPRRSYRQGSTAGSSKSDCVTSKLEKCGASMAAC